MKSTEGVTVPSIHNGVFEQSTGMMKNHTPEIALECIDKGYTIFTSDAPYNLISDNIDERLTNSLHLQDMDEMGKCSVCQVDYY